MLATAQNHVSAVIMYSLARENALSKTSIDDWCIAYLRLTIRLINVGNWFVFGTIEGLE